MIVGLSLHPLSSSFSYFRSLLSAVLDLDCFRLSRFEHHVYGASDIFVFLSYLEYPFDKLTLTRVQDSVIRQQICEASVSSNQERKNRKYKKELGTRASYNCRCFVERRYNHKMRGTYRSLVRSRSMIFLT